MADIDDLMAIEVIHFGNSQLTYVKFIWFQEFDPMPLLMQFLGY